MKQNRGRSHSKLNMLPLINLMSRVSTNRRRSLGSWWTRSVGRSSYMRLPLPDSCENRGPLERPTSVYQLRPMIVVCKLLKR